MEVMCRDELVGDPLPLEVSADATAAEVLRDACALFGRAEMHTALEVGGVVWEAGSGDVSAGSLGLEAGCTVMLRRDRTRTLMILKWQRYEIDVPWLGDICRYPSNCDFPDWIWDDEVVVFATVSHNGQGLAYASAALRDNERVAGAAFGHDTAALRYASDRLRDDELFMLKAVQHDGCALEYASATIADDETVVTAAVKQKGTTLKYASDRLRDNESIVLKAVRQNGQALEYASAALRDNETVVAAAVENTEEAIIGASDRLRKCHGKSGFGSAVVRGCRRYFGSCFSATPQSREAW